ncbi:putative 2-component regulatory system-sensor histidine kinase [Chlamydia trachomatis]|nr:putative 2-component regulatory system-sensor histidine kinase [Chlamydia trachomatis]
MAEELEHADNMRRDLIANVSHELRTPVSALQAMVENLADGVVEPTPSNMEAIVNQTHKLADLITFLLDLSRVEAGAESLVITSFDFKDFINNIVETVRIADAGHNHSISLNIENNIMLVGDKNRLSQLFTNVVSNAIKHSADNTKILISAKSNHEKNILVCNVINFGTQIPEENRADIFRRFVKGSQGIGTESGGTGLGLSIARWAALLHHGNIRVVDDKRGVNFEITLPLTYSE